jgi:hypothetical protein
VRRAGDFRQQGGSNVLLSGRSSDSNMLIWTDRTSTNVVGGNPSPVVQFRGNSSPCSQFDGRIYAYTSHVDLGGNPCAGVALNMTIVADTIEFQGSAEFHLPYDASIAPPLYTVGLID